MMTTAATKPNRRPGAALKGDPRSAPNGAFTLLEMMVVVGLIAVMAAMALPSVIALYNAGADAQAYNLVSAQLTAARARAVTSNTFAGIHVQMADVLLSDTGLTGTGLVHPDLQGVTYSGLILYDSEQKHFDIMTGMAPTRVPGTVSLGYASEEISPPAGSTGTGYLEGTLASGGSSESPFIGSGTGTTATGVANLSKLTTFSVVFSPLGAVTRFVNREPIRFNQNSLIFAYASNSAIDPLDTTYGSRKLWRLFDANDTVNNYSQDRYGVTALTIFDYVQYEAAGTDGSPYAGKVDYLNKNARVLPLNAHTGLLYDRE